MASRATYDAGAAALDAFAKFMMNRQLKKEDRAARQEENAAHELALEERERRAEERAIKRRETTPVARKTYQGDASSGPPELMIEEVNDSGAAIRSAPASHKIRFAEEDREFKRGDMSKRTGIAERNADSSARRAAAAEAKASATGKEKEERPITRNEALKALSSLRYRAQEGESARAVAVRDGVDYDSLTEAANRGAKEKEPGLVERGVNAVGRALGGMADSFKKPPILGRPGERKAKEEKAPYPEGTKLRKGGKVYVVRNGVPVLEG